MKSHLRIALLLALVLLVSATALASAYDRKPKVVVVIIVDQLRGDLVERYHDEFIPGGFRRFTDEGAWFTTCYFQYSNTRTAPGHATLGTGSYTLGHGIVNNEWFDPKIDPGDAKSLRCVADADLAAHHTVSSVFDPNTLIVGIEGNHCGSSPFRLLTDTLGDELKLATGGKARVFGIAFKDRAAILPVGFTANAAYWIDHVSGKWVSSTYYMKELPGWLAAFNGNGERATKYLNQEWKDAQGNVLRTTKQEKTADGTVTPFYDLVGPTPLANDYTIEFARELMERENVGSGPVTDLVTISFSSHDILGHKTGPDSPEEHAMMLALDREFAAFFEWLDKRYGRENVVLAFAADHGIAPMPDYSAKLRMPAFSVDGKDFGTQINRMVAAKLGQPGDYVHYFDYPNAFLNAAAFEAVHVNQADAEKMVGEAMMALGLRGYVTKGQLAQGVAPATVFARKYLNAYSPHASWYVLGMTQPFVVGYPTGTDHAMPYTYDSHIPLAFAGPMFRPGHYRETVEPVDLAVTLSSVLGVNPPASAVGRVLHEAFVDAPAPGAPSEGVTK